MSHPQPVILSAAEENDDWQPHAAEEFQQVGLVGRIAIGLLGASTFTHLLCTWSDWNTYGVVNRYLGGLPNAENEDLNRADAISQVTSIPNVIISVAAAVVFVIWLWRARVNSEVFCQADHRRSHGWVLASWFCPGPNLWYPKQIVDDVWVASDPKTPVYADDLRRHRKPMLTSVWWMAWVGALAFDVVIRRFLMWMNPTVGTLRGIALAGTASLILTAVSAIAATLVIRKITAMQTSREWVPWWDQREPKLTAVPTYADDATSEQQAIVETIPAPALRLERQPELQLAGGGAEDAPPKWSPFAPVVENWQEPVDPGPETQQFSPYESWQDEPAKVEETPSYQQTAASLEPSDWTPQPSPFTPAAATSDDLLSSASTPSWQTETVAPSLSLVQSDPYRPAAYQSEPAEPEQPAAPSWASSYSDTYSYDSSSYDTDSAADYLTSSAPIPAPEPEPAPVARAGRRAARVAVDSPSTIQAAVPETTYYAPEPTVSSPLPDDFLTPSKPLPTVPSFGPEPAATYSAPEPTYSAYEPPYEAPAPQPSHDSYYAPQESSYQYSEPEPTNNSESNYSATSYETYTPQPSYDSYNDSSYQQSSYPSQETSYTDQSAYGPAEYGSTPEYSNNADYNGYSAQGQQSPYSYEQQQPVEPENTSEVTAPRTHPRRRWV